MRELDAALGQEDEPDNGKPREAPLMRARKVTVHPGREIEGIEPVLPE